MPSSVAPGSGSSSRACSGKALQLRRGASSSAYMWYWSSVACCLGLVTTTTSLLTLLQMLRMALCYSYMCRRGWTSLAVFFDCFILYFCCLTGLGWCCILCLALVAGSCAERPAATEVSWMCSGGISTLWHMLICMMPSRCAEACHACSSRWACWSGCS
jgi:hypothetical protein